MDSEQFTKLITSEAELGTLIGEPSDLVIRKQLSVLDHHCRAFITLSPFLLIGTVNGQGMGDVSPRGDAPGAVLVLDEKTLVIPERPGNRRADTLRNILETSSVGLHFMIPGIEETLRVNGRARLVRDEALLERLSARGKRPLLAIVVEVKECFLHCAKALKRSQLWNTETWPKRSDLPSLAQMIMDQVQPPDTTVEELEEHIVDSYTNRLY